MSELIELEERAPVEGQIDCVEVYLPKKIKHLSGLYSFLRDSVEERKGGIVLEGFSIYEVDGAFRGINTVWDERSLVIRLLLIRPADAPESNLRAKISDLERMISGIASAEEEIWICNYSQGVSIFRPGSVVRQGE